ncbi:unnamed protein product [Brassica oleracea var. botrytis]
MKFNFQNYQQLRIYSESYKIPLAGTVRLVHRRGMSLATSYTFSQTSPFGSQCCESMSHVKTFASIPGVRSYILGSCSGHLLLYTSGLYVVNPLTKRF